MKAELMELKTLYMHALQNAGLLEELKAAGLLGDDTLQQLKSVGESPIMTSMAAMDAITALDPLRALLGPDSECAAVLPFQPNYRLSHPKK